MFYSQILFIALAMFGGMLACIELGRFAAKYQIRRIGETPGRAFSALEGSVFGLMSLLLAFTFSSTATRFEGRRQLAVREANTIEISWARVALVQEAYRRRMNEKLRQYLDTRILFYSRITDRKVALEQLRQTTDLQDELWALGIAGTTGSSPAVISLVLGSLNTMTELTNDSLTLAQTHTPGLIQAMLIVLPLICAALAGFETSELASRYWLPTWLFALMMSLTVVAIFDLDYPRVGLVRLDIHDQILLDLQTRMQPH